MSEAKAFSSTKKLTTCALLTALALIFSYIEFLVPLSLGIPGIKIGLANIVIVMALYALCGGLFSLAVMALLKKTDVFSLTGVSMAGGAAHNIAQLAAAAVIVGSSKVFMYMPVLVLAGMAAGIFNGIVCSLVMRKIK